MRMNRRNVLVGLGTIVAGGGAALGTGAFSSVEANRTVSVEKVGDANAFLGIDVNSAYASSGSGDAVEINLDGSDDSDGFNEDAITTINSVLTLTNNAADDEAIEVSFGDKEDGGHESSRTVNIDDTGEVTFTLARTDGGDYAELTANDSDTDSVDINVEVDTTADVGSGNDQDLKIYAFDSTES